MKKNIYNDKVQFTGDNHPNGIQFTYILIYYYELLKYKF